MKNAHKFIPTVSASLETRSVPSAIGGFTVTSHAIVLPRAIVTPPVTHAPGTFSQGELPSYFGTGSNRFTTNAMVTPPTSHTTTVPTTHIAVAAPTAVTVTPHAVVTPPVTHPPGTFSQGELPAFFGTGGNRFTLSRF